jgi:hypothetical protein
MPSIHLRERNATNTQHHAVARFDVRPAPDAAVSAHGIDAAFDIMSDRRDSITICNRTRRAHVNARAAGNALALGESIRWSINEANAPTTSLNPVHELPLNLFARIKTQPARDALITIKAHVRMARVNVMLGHCVFTRTMNDAVLIEQSLELGASGIRTHMPIGHRSDCKF